MIHLFTDQYISETNVISQWDRNLRETFLAFCGARGLETNLVFSDDGLKNNLIFHGNDIVFISLHTDRPHSDYCWSVGKIIALRKSAPTIQIHVLFGDMELPSQQIFAAQIYAVVDYIHYTGKYLAITQFYFKKLKYHQPVLGFDSFSFYPKIVPLTMRLGYTGRVRHDRLALFRYLKEKAGIEIVLRGGEREQNFPFESYLRSLASCTVNISFSRVGYYHVVNLRPFEIFFIGGKFVERASIETIRFFRPGLDYHVYFFNRQLRKDLEQNFSFVSKQNLSNVSNNADERIYDWSSFSFWSDCLSGNTVRVLKIRDSLSSVSFLNKILFALLFVQQYIVFGVSLVKFFLACNVRFSCK